MDEAGQRENTALPAFCLALGKGGGERLAGRERENSRAACASPIILAGGKLVVGKGAGGDLTRSHCCAGKGAAGREGSLGCIAHLDARGQRQMAPGQGFHL